MESLDYINPGDSGLKYFDRNEFSKKLKDYSEKKAQIILPEFYLGFLFEFISEKHKKLSEDFKEDPSKVSSIEVKALKILNSLLLGEETTIKDIFPFTAPELSMRIKLGKKISNQILCLFDLIRKNISSFAKNDKFLRLNFWSLSEALPEMRFIYAKYVLENKLDVEYKNLEKEIQAIENDVEKVYIESFYYRTIGDEAKCEESLMSYRLIYKPDTDNLAKIKSYANENFYRADLVLDNWGKVLAEINRIQSEVERKAGLLNSTCDYFKCSDCCSNTFPTMSFTEYKYLEKWMEENNYPVEKIKERSEEIQKDHETKYGKRLEVVDRALPENDYRGVENPHAYKFSCPFLEENKCSIYEARPLLCRGFGLATDNDVSVKTCKFYLAQYQHNSSPDNERYAYDLRIAEMLAASSDRHLNEGKHLSGTLVSWFSE